MSTFIVPSLPRASIGGNYGFRFSAVPDESRSLTPDDLCMEDRAHDLVADAMHRGLITCAPDSSGFSVARTMAAHRIHSVVVKMPDGLPRLVTDAEIVAALYDGRLETCTAEELSRPSALVRPEDTLGFALERMHEQRTGHAVVIGRSSRLLGVVSVLDLVESVLHARP
jgi:CBS domain-containing protein